MATYPTRLRRWTRAEYERLIEIGVFRPGEPVELLGGELMVSEPQGSAHYTAIGLMEDALRAACWDHSRSTEKAYIGKATIRLGPTGKLISTKTDGTDDVASACVSESFASASAAFVFAFVFAAWLAASADSVSPAPAYRP